jgi:hypothetical protein
MNKIFACVQSVPESRICHCLIIKYAARDVLPDKYMKGLVIIIL